VLTARSAKFEELSERLWLPIVVPVVMLLAGVAAIDAHTRTARWFNMFLAVFAAVWIVSGMLFAARMLHKCFSDGPDVFNTAAWRQSPTIRFMRNSALKVFFTVIFQSLCITTQVSSAIRCRIRVRCALHRRPSLGICSSSSVRCKLMCNVVRECISSGFITPAGATIRIAYLIWGDTCVCVRFDLCQMAK